MFCGSAGSNIKNSLMTCMKKPTEMNGVGANQPGSMGDSLEVNLRPLNDESYKSNDED